MLPIIRQPDQQVSLLRRFESHRGVIVELASAYRPTGTNLSRAMELSVIRGPLQNVVGLDIAKYGDLESTIADVRFDIEDALPTRQLRVNGRYYIQTQWDATSMQWQFRIWDNAANAALEVARAGGTGFTSQWQNIANVSANAEGIRTFQSKTGLVIDFAPEYSAGSMQAGTAASIIVGTPTSPLNMTFHGGSQSNVGAGDTLRIAGDGQTKGSVYRPSSTISGGGQILFAGPTITFSGIEPLIVHGLPDFRMETPDAAATLSIDSQDLEDSIQQQVQLHSLTIEGQVTWTQRRQFNLVRPTLDPRSVGRVMAVSDDGLTMIVGAKASPSGSATSGNLVDGLVLVYQWNGNAWIEKARLEPGDLREGLTLGGDFGASVAIDGNRLAVGAPGDAPTNASIAASFVPTGTSIQDNTILLAAPTTLQEGQAITYDRGAGFGSIGLSEGQIYYVKRVPGNPNAIQLTTQRSGSAVPLSTPASSPDFLGSVSFVPTSESIQNNQILFPTDTTITSGQPLVYRSGNAGESFGLIDGQVYFARRVPGNARAIQLALTVDAANDPSAAVVPLSFPTRGADRLRLTNYGAVYVFERANADAPWLQTQKITPSDATAGMYFGASIALRGNALLVGAPGELGANSGEAAYLYRYSNGNWDRTSAQTGTGDFGRSVALAGNFGVTHFGQTSIFDDFAVVGAPLTDQVHVYRAWTNSLLTWSTLTATLPQSGENFGAAVAATIQPRVDIVNGNPTTTQVRRIVVGAPLWDGPPVFTGDTNHADQGRVFVFDLISSQWTPTARLTAEGGLPEAEAAAEARAGARFGAAVALDSQYVIAGAPGHSSGGALQTGAAYIFYELQNGTAGTDRRSSWTRSSGASGSGRLQATSPAENDRFGESVAIWRDPNIGAARAMVGIPGYDEVAGESRSNLGAIRTFTTSGVLPSVTLESMYSEKLAFQNPTSGTAYDPISRTLFVADRTAKVVYTYINEGLFWRPSTTLSGWVMNRTNDFGIDMDLDSTNGRLVVGTSSDYVYVFRRETNGSWSQQSFIDGSAMGGGYGQSVAIDGNRLVVGAPQATVKYYNTSQGKPNYLLDLGRGAASFAATITNSAPGAVTSSPVGAAHLYSLNSNAWSYDRLLMPDDPNLPLQTSTFQAGKNPQNTGGVSFRIYDNGPWWGWESPGSHDLEKYDAGEDDMDDNTVAVRLRPRTRIVLKDNNLLGEDDLTLSNDSYDSSLIVYFRNSNAGGGFNDLSHYRNIIDKVDHSQIQPISTADVSTYYLFSMANAAWGSSVDIVGDSVVVGASGRNRTATYQLSQPDFLAWNVRMQGLNDQVRIARTNNAIANGFGGFGSEVSAIPGKIFTGAPSSNQVGLYNVQLSSLTLDRNFNVPAGQQGGGFGGSQTISNVGSLVLIGAPTADNGGQPNTGAAYLYNSNAVYQGVQLRPYRFDSGNGGRTVVDTSAVQFGVAPSIISDGVYVVGNNSSIASNRFLYNFRQRGPAWSPNLGPDLNTPASLAKAKLGSSVAISGTTAVLGAPDFGNHGAIFLFNNTGTNLNPVWEFSAQLEAPGFQNGDEFGASIAIQGDQLVVGSPGRNDDRGAAYVYQRVNGSWILQHQVVGDTVNGRAGSSVSIDGDYAAVGAPSASSASVYLLRRIAGQWSSDAKLVTPQSNNRFGTSVRVDATSLFVGAPNQASGPGAVYVYSLALLPQDVPSNVTAGPSALPRTSASNGDEFGTSLDVSGKYVVVGAPGAQSSRGAAFVFERPTSTTPWVQTNLDYSAGANAGDRFGTSVAIDGVQLIVGAPGRSQGRGEAFSYGIKSNGLWTLETPADSIDPTLTGGDAFTGDNVGFAVAIQGDLALLGAPQRAGRPVVIDTDGSGYAFVRQINPPATRTLPERQSVLVAGARTNTIGGSIAGTALPTLQFFDIKDVVLQTSSANDPLGAPIVSELTIGVSGFDAFGLQRFRAEGNINFTNQADDLQLPTNGLFEYVASVSLQGTAPVALDLTGDGLQFVARTPNGPKFDFNGTGTPEPTAWLGPNDGWLFIDLDGAIQVSRNELSFVSLAPTANSDLDALRILFDANGDDRLDSLDSEWTNLKVWKDANQDGVTTSDEVFTLDALDIVSIGLVSNNRRYSAGSGTVTVLGEASLRKRDGSQRTVGDVVLNTDIGIVEPGADRINATYDFAGGPVSTYIADADTDWILYDGFLIASDGRQGINLQGFTNVELKCGDGNNR
ncbi:MAG: FG-GAP repeat protein, partial [Pirellula sp.]|nr:FG-GAP repeat protein [Pirellula sp.]